MNIKIGVLNNIFFYLFSFIKDKGFFGEINPTFIPVDNYGVLKSLFEIGYFDIILCDSGYSENVLKFNNELKPNYKKLSLFKEINKILIYPFAFKNFYKIFFNKSLLLHRDQRSSTFEECEIVAGIPEDSEYFKSFILNYLKNNNFSYQRIIFKTTNEKDVEYFFEKKDINIGLSIAPYSFEIIKKNLGIVSNLVEQDISCNCINFYLSDYILEKQEEYIVNFFQNLFLGLNIFINNQDFWADFNKIYNRISIDEIFLISEDLKNNFVYNEDLIREVADKKDYILPFIYLKNLSNESLKNLIDEKIKNKELEGKENNNVKVNYEIESNRSVNVDKKYLENYIESLIRSMLTKSKISIDNNNPIYPTVFFELYNNLIYENEILSIKNRDFNNKIKLLQNSLEETKSNLFNLFNDLNRTSENLMIQKIRADEAIKIKSKFFASITHDLKTPIYGIDSMLDNLIKIEKDKNKIDILFKMKRSIETLISLIEDLLLISKVEESKLTLSKKLFNFDELLKELYDNISAKIADKDIRLIFEKENNVPEYLIGDSLRIKQILYNLLGNSSKFTEKGYIKLSVSCNFIERNYIKLFFKVEDTGIGIKSDKINKIFEPFEQENEEIKYKYGGTGLGLSIVKKLIELMNGDIKCESEVGKGTKFFFDINLEIPDKEEIEKLIPYSKNECLENIKNVNFIDANILIAEDNDININIIDNILKNIKQIKYKIVKNGEEALEELKNNNIYKLLITDVQMPKMDGIELSKNLKKMALPITIVGFTAFDEDFIENENKIYFDEIYQKPYNEEKILKILIKHIGVLKYEKDNKNELITNKEKEKILNIKKLNKKISLKNDKIKNKKINDYIGVSDYDKLKKLFIEETEKKLISFRKCIDDKNITDIRFIGHNLKGTAPIFGFNSIGIIGKKISEACKNEDFIELKKLYEKLKIEVNKIKKKN
ncbi:MAG: ATP-binding protein [Spirochaetes bacterium]|nr:ATP-binding protein [Spirochaetota bacterium]